MFLHCDIKTACISVNFEDVLSEPLLDYRKLHEYVTKRLISGKMTYIFLDEIQNVPQFQKAVDSLFIKDNVDVYITGSNAQISFEEYADSLISYGRKTTSVTFESYLEALTGAFILYKVDRYDVKGKQHLKSLEKYYLVAMSLRNLLLGDKNTDIGHILENIVYLELLRRGYLMLA
ncbi:MAG: AAA family ATPase [Saccharofermentanales bacterium]